MISERGTCWATVVSRNVITLTLSGYLDLEAVQRDDTKLAAIAKSVFAGLATRLPRPEFCEKPWRCTTAVALASVCASGKLDEPTQCIPTRAAADLNRNLTPSMWPTEVERRATGEEALDSLSGSELDVSVLVTQTMGVSGIAPHRRPQLLPPQTLVMALAALFGYGDVSDEFAEAMRGSKKPLTFAGMKVVTVRAGGHRNVVEMEDITPTTKQPAVGAWVAAACTALVAVVLFTAAAAVRRAALRRYAQCEKSDIQQMLENSTHLPAGSDDESDAAEGAPLVTVGTRRDRTCPTSTGLPTLQGRSGPALQSV